MAEDTHLNTDGNQLNPPREFYNNQSEPGHVVYTNAGNNRAESRNQPSFDLMRELVTENEKMRDENLRLEQKLVESKIQICNLKSENMKLKIQVAELNTALTNYVATYNQNIKNEIAAQVMPAGLNSVTNTQGTTDQNTEMSVEDKNQSIAKEYDAQALPKKVEECTRKVASKSVLMSMQKRVAEGVIKFFEGKKAETDLYNTYQEWYEDISDRMTDNVPLIYEDYLLVKYGEMGGLPNYCNLYYNEHKTKRFGRIEKGFRITKYQGGWLDENKEHVWILHPEKANDALQMYYNEKADRWESTSPKTFQRKENRNRGAYYSMIAFATKAPDRFSKVLFYKKDRIKEGVWKFLEGKESPTDFYKTYEEWYQDILRRLARGSRLEYLRGNILGQV